MLTSCVRFDCVCVRVLCVFPNIVTPASCFLSRPTGQVFVLIPLAYLMGALAGQGIGASATPKLPSSWEMVVDIFGVIIVDEVLFYYGHRLFHENTWLYINVHKIHHEFQFPCGLVAAYAHPSEMLISNVLPLGLGE